MIFRDRQTELHHNIYIIINHHPHLISLDSDGDGEEDAGSQTEMAEALSQVVEPEREAGHAESHLGMTMINDHLNKEEDGVDDH